MDRNEVYTQVAESIAKILPDMAGSVSETSDLEADLGMDSIHMIELVANLEKELDVSIPDADAESVRSVSELVELVRGFATVS